MSGPCDSNPKCLTTDSSSTVVVCFEGYLPEMSKEIRCFPHLGALCSPLWYPLPLNAPPNLQPHRAGRRFCWWMLKAALVPQQLTLLLQETACQVDGISPPLLPVTQSRGGYRQMLHLCVCFTVLPTVQSEHERSDTRCIVSHQLLPLLSLTTLSGDRSAGKCLSHIIQVVPPLVVAVVEIHW